MTNVIELAKQAGIEFQENTGITGRKRVTTYGSQPIEKIELLIKLVRNATLEEAAQKLPHIIGQWRITSGPPTSSGGQHVVDAIRNLKEQTP